jgi:transposase
VHLTTFLFALLSQLRGFRLERIRIAEEGVIVELSSTRRTARCPLCSRRSHRVHSRYERTLADLPWAHRSVTLHLHVRRFFCPKRRCPRRIFAEQRPELAAPRGRRTQALQSRLLDLACAVGGQAGARLASRQGVLTSRATLLRLVHRAPLPTVGSPRVLGVDDWSQRRGHTYGTILVDADRRRPVELLPDRTATSLAHWLHAHPSVESITRDRSTTYAEGASRGAPDAVQVADRFHLIDDLGDAVERVLDRHRSALRELTLASTLATVGGAGDQSADLQRGPRSSLSRIRRQHRKHDERRAVRMGRYARLQALKQQGWTIGAIAHELGMSRRTVERWNRVDGFPERKPRRRPPNPLAP